MAWDHILGVSEVLCVKGIQRRWGVKIRIFSKSDFMKGI